MNFILLGEESFYTCHFLLPIDIKIAIANEHFKTNFIEELEFVLMLLGNDYYCIGTCWIVWYYAQSLICQFGFYNECFELDETP